MEITILTPTYNRRCELERLYESLVHQNNKDFEWLIVDDGSTDDTCRQVEVWKQEADFNISYYYKENGGKHRALNFAYSKISTPLTFIVDSDDWLSVNAIETILDKYARYREEPDICGFSFLRGDGMGGLLSSGCVPKDGLRESYVECRINRNLEGDMAEVWYTHCLKEFPFPEYENEKFLGEDVVWIRMSGKYRMLFFNDVIYISEYLEEGLTRNRRKHNIASPNGCVTRAWEFLNADVKLQYKIKPVLQYIIYGRFAGRKLTQLFQDCPRKLMFIIFFLPATILYFRWKNEERNIA